MSQKDNNLLSFLKNQSLFNGSPTRKMSSRSRDRKSDRNRSPGANQQNQQFNGNYAYNSSFNTTGTPHFNDNNRVSNNVSYPTGGNNQQGGNFGQNQGGYNTQGANYNTTTAYNTGGVQGGQLRSTFETTNQFSSNDNVNNALLSTAAVVANQKTYASSFESARVETAQRLEGLAQKVKNEINNLNYKL